MTTPALVTCDACHGEIVAGTIYCWRHATSPPKIGAFREDHGQLVWHTTGACSAKLERAIAVLLDGIQVTVRVADEHARPARVNLEVGNPAHTGGAATPVFVPLATLLDAVIAGDEQIEATRFA